MKLNDLLHLVDDMELMEISILDSNGVCNDEPFICVIIYNNEADFDKESTRK